MSCFKRIYVLYPRQIVKNIQSQGVPNSDSWAGCIASLFIPQCEQQLAFHRRERPLLQFLEVFTTRRFQGLLPQQAVHLVFCTCADGRKDSWEL